MKLRRYWPIPAILLGLLIAATGAFLLLNRTQKTATLAVPPPTIITDRVFPSTAPGLPDGSRIVIADLGIDLPLVPGDGDNAPLYKAATHPGLKLPGQGGRSMIYAHARAGMFGPLFNARTGQKVEIIEPGGKNLNYTIHEYYPRWSPLDLRWLQPADHEELVLITCTTYNINDPRIVAVAEPS